MSSVDPHAQNNGIKHPPATTRYISRRGKLGRARNIISGSIAVALATLVAAWLSHAGTRELENAGTRELENAGIRDLENAGTRGSENATTRKLENAGTLRLTQTSTPPGLQLPMPSNRLVGTPPAGKHKSLLRGIKSWGYQLQNLNVATAAASHYDLLVLEPNLLDYGPKNWGHEALQRLKAKPNGDRRRVVAYLSIGEAEAYRSYWRRNWVGIRGKRRETSTLSGPARPARAHKEAARTGVAAPPKPIYRPSRHMPRKGHPTGDLRPQTARSGGSSSRLRGFAIPDLTEFTDQLKTPLQFPTQHAPAWLGYENANWRGNYYVRFWREGWQRIIMGAPGSAIDMLIKAGFDGVFLDRADAYEAWRHERPGAKADMTRFISRLAGYARKQKPDFIVILQNAEGLLGSADLRDKLDAVAKEDLLYGNSDRQRANSASDISQALNYLRLMQRAGRPVLVIEYLNESAVRKTTTERLKALGLIPYFGPRELDELTGKL